MNLPNQLTLARLVVTLPFVVALSVDWRGAKALALCLFLLASLTDYADGIIARRYNLVTVFGQLMDPLVDKVMTMSAFICLVALHDIPAWVVILIASREFLITGLRLIAQARGRTLPAEKLGKHKTAWQIVTIIYFLTIRSVQEVGSSDRTTAGDPLLGTLGAALLGITVALTLLSGIGYLRKNWDLLRDS
ncbi:MAG TPA: CDP-diacylglycerol--glycerol-3-phosphate 3-phosphatidyltransferase [Chthoniobacterales bacterium]|nr:CDP-diacylglycerol--glycerol-3-phosphate 3-phosphatidyltransferase [Chthoniobacterales bacterium]